MSPQLPTAVPWLGGAVLLEEFGFGSRGPLRSVCLWYPLKGLLCP